MVRDITRFAPSPTGYLHVGHALSAWFAWEQGSQCLLRIEDIDRTRCKPVFTDAVYEDLQWLGLTWPMPVRKQSDHFSDYRAVLDRLQSLGLMYPCFCTRKDIADEVARSPHAPHQGEEMMYPQICKRLSAGERQERMAAGEAYALRLDVAEAVRRCTGPLYWFDRTQGRQRAMPEMFGDVVLARKDTPASYHLCVTHDDALQNISCVTRGQDLFSATHLHRLLQEILGYPVPEYHHHPLLMDKSGKKFSKRDHALTIREIRNKGFSADQLRDMIHSQDLSPLFKGERGLP